MFSYRIWICWDLSRICLASIRKLGLKVANRFKMWKNSSNDESVELNMAISQINSQCTIFDKKITENGSEQKSWELTVWNKVNFSMPSIKFSKMHLYGSNPSSIYSWFLKPLSVLHSRFPTQKLWVVAYLKIIIFFPSIKICFFILSYATF